MNKVIKYGLIGCIVIASFLTLNYFTLNINNDITSKVDINNTLSPLKTINTEDGIITLGVESNNAIYNEEAWNDGMTLEMDYYKKGFLGFTHKYGNSIIAKVREDGISVNNFIVKNKNQTEYLYGFIEDGNVKNINLDGNNKEGKAEIIAYGKSRFWFSENLYGSNPKITPVE